MATLNLISIRDIENTHFYHGHQIVAISDIPCHLYLRWSEVEPQTHIVPVYLRGIFMHGNTYFCFVAYHDLEQCEAGDTLIHTFILHDWPVNTWRWYYFWGKINDVTTRSTTAIFKLFHAEPQTHQLILEKWTCWQTPSPTIELLLYERWGPSPPPPPLAFYETWGNTLTENNPWDYNIPIGGVDWELYQSLIRLYNPSIDGCGIKVDFTPGDMPLLNPAGESVTFSASSVAPEPLTHDAYIPAFLHTTNGVDTYLVEMIITRGDAWGPWGPYRWAGPNTCGKDYGLYPSPENIKDFWVWARNAAGLPADPTGWYISRIALLFEAVEYEPEPYLINDWVTLYYPPI